MLPPLVPITSLFSTSSAQVCLSNPGLGSSLLDGCQESMEQLSLLNLSMSALKVLNVLAPHPLLLRTVSDTMISTYSRVVAAE